MCRLTLLVALLGCATLAPEVRVSALTRRGTRVQSDRTSAAWYGEVRASTRWRLGRPPIVPPRDRPLVTTSSRLFGRIACGGLCAWERRAAADAWRNWR
ncbi:MAG: hypothetical protein AAGE52_36240 [Myxococcota bacterium]